MISRKLYYLHRIRNNQWLNSAELKELQERGLKAIVEHAYKQIPFYHKRFKESDLKPSDIKTLEDLKKLPIITREEVMKNYSELIPQVYKKLYSVGKFVSRSTSGTSHPPLKVPYDERAEDYLDALYLRGLFEVGLNPWRKSAFYWYKPFKKKFHRRLGFMRKVRIPSKLSEEEQLKLLEKIDPTYLFYFPSSLYLIAKRIKTAKLNPELIICHAEPLSPGMRKIIESTFKCKVYDQYGSSEFRRIAWECKTGSYHINADSVIVEFLDENENPVSSGERGNVIITSLTNYMFPLIRYAIGDMAIPLDGSCPCGRGLPLLKDIEGRKEDFITLPSGKIFAPKEVIDSIVDIEGISKFWIGQMKDKIEVRVIPLNEFSKRLEEEINDRLLNLFKETVEISVIPVDRIPKSAGGKIKLVGPVPKKLI